MPEKRILVVDDDPDVGLFCRTILEPLGYSVMTVFEASAALEKAKEARPQLIILDIILEEPDSGLKLAKEIPEVVGPVPIILLSSIAKASGTFYDISSLGVSEVVNKPIDPEELIKKVENLCGRS